MVTFSQREKEGEEGEGRRRYEKDDCGEEGREKWSVDGEEDRPVIHIEAISSQWELPTKKEAALSSKELIDYDDYHFPWI